MKIGVVWTLIGCFSSMMQADWNLKAIYNDSDLPLTGAYRLKDGKKKATYVDKTIKSAKAKSVIMIGSKGYRVPTNASKEGYLCFELIDKNRPEAKYELCVDSQRKNTILSKRSKAQKVANLALTEDGTSDDTSFARAVLKNNGTVVYSDQKSYEDDDQDAEFDVFVEGLNGSYALKLLEVVE